MNKKWMLRLLVSVFIVMGLLLVPGLNSQDGAASVDAAKRADIKRMMELSGAGKLGVQMINQMIPVFKRTRPNVPDKFWNDFMAEVDGNELVEMVIPSYEKYFTHGDIKELIKFYESPVGKKLVAAQPRIMQESMAVGQKWGRKLGEKVARKLKEQGYTK